MTDLLSSVIAAHGGLDRWRTVRAIDVTFNFSGGLLELKGYPGHRRPSASVDAATPRTVFQRLDGLVFPTLRRVVRRTPEGPLLSGRTSFILDYTNLVVRKSFGTPADGQAQLNLREAMPMRYARGPAKYF
jgi:hypothetical protein